ncbi:hypothetical protein Acsp03_68400 [Actinomadura sp. NBRC 104412]|uniref:hypothetical protein n=1 Tax=Actinomadura sp. NBRC 104412 TaxID=3032203 RepID=UPI0024A31DBC|nr:hypothetical protein [Actinomadura sp. NBRC 104412]GLZ09374.1 hypothetical protein Acsp03_68400 [Actinomadura sp. NBRC 104412]
MLLPEPPHREVVAGVGAEQFFYELRDGSAADAAMSPLRSPYALVYLALMAAHLGDGRISTA